MHGNWAGQPYVTRVCALPELGRMQFGQLLDLVGLERFDRNTGTGHIIFSIPGRMAARSAIDVIGIGHDVTDAKTHLARCVGQISPPTPTPTEDVNELVTTTQRHKQ